MKKLIFFLCPAFILLYSCKKQFFITPEPASVPVLTHTVSTNTLGEVLNVEYYNEMELVIADTLFRSNRIPSHYGHWKYNVKGKATRWELYALSLYANGYFVAEDYVYRHDTIRTLKRHYVRGTLTDSTKYYHNASGQLTLDSAFQIGSNISTIESYEYDAKGRMTLKKEWKSTGDTLNHDVYQYTDAPNRVERLWTALIIRPTVSSSSKLINHFSATGKVLLEEYYIPSDQFAWRKVFIYDAEDRLSESTTTTPYSIQVQRHFYGTNGKIEKIAYYNNNQLGAFKHHFYK